MGDQLARIMASWPQPPGPPSDLAAAIAGARQKFPALGPTLDRTNVQWGDPATSPAPGGHLEFFPPWEQYNPRPGNPTLELYDPQMQGRALSTAIAGDTLHYTGSIDPRTGQPVDPQWYAMKRALIDSRTPDQLAMDQRAYSQAQAEGDQRSMSDWMQESRGDAYIRGKLTPDAMNDWRDVYTPQQAQLLQSMSQYLQKTPSVTPDPWGQITSRGIWGY